jgi:hypothetical protein
VHWHQHKLILCALRRRKRTNKYRTCSQCVPSFGFCEKLHCAVKWLFCCADGSGITKKCGRRICIANEGSGGGGRRHLSSRHPALCWRSKMEARPFIALAAPARRRRRRRLSTATTTTAGEYYCSLVGSFAQRWQWSMTMTLYPLCAIVLAVIRWTLLRPAVVMCESMWASRARG